MEEIIKKAIWGGYKLNVKNSNYPDPNDLLKIDVKINTIILDPIFWQTLGRACGWDIHFDEDKGFNYQWLQCALKFHEINLTESLDKAVEYLKEVVEK